MEHLGANSIGVDDTTDQAILYQGPLSLRLRAHATPESKLSPAQRVPKRHLDLPDVSGRNLADEDRTHENRPTA